YWPRRSVSIRPGTVTIAFLDAIEPGLDRQSFLQLLEERIEAATAELIAVAFAADPSLMGARARPDSAVS
ncbi:MAG: 1-acyl-sn-glycerol-3-phosphate acyltransferase, partial [Methylocella sp.]